MILYIKYSIRLDIVWRNENIILILQEVLRTENARFYQYIAHSIEQLLNYKSFRVDWLYSYIKNDKSGISGEIAKITNISDHKIILKEEMFFRRGIRAVRLEKFELEPKESCYLFFVGGDK